MTEGKMQTLLNEQNQSAKKMELEEQEELNPLGKLQEPEQSGDMRESEQKLSERTEDSGTQESPEAAHSSAVQSMRMSRIRCELARERVQRPDAMPCGSAPYGYLPSPEGKGGYVTDDETAPFVRMMFKWAISGLSCQQIAQRMELLGVGTPGQRRLGQSPDPSKWNSHVVLKIIQNPNYTGDLYLGRMQQALYKSQSRRRTSEDEWVIRERMHEPLVSREDFQRVQKVIASNNRRKGKRSSPEGDDREQAVSAGT